MKKFIIILLLTTIIALQSCDLDINDNPNSATSSSITVDLVLPAALANTGKNLITYNSYGSFLVGYQLPGAGISGYGSTYTYNYTSSDNTTLWLDVLDNLSDYQAIINKADAQNQYVLYAAVSHIMKAFNFQLLVDTYGDVPYTESLLGDRNLTPGFNDDASVYEALVKELNEAIATIDKNSSDIGVTVSEITSISDPLFKGDLSSWKQFANNIKLRLLVRASGSSIDSFVDTAFDSFSSDGFLKEDITVNPGYSSSGTQNPYWSTLHSSIAGSITTAANYYIPSAYTLTYYDGTVLLDSIRGKLIYNDFKNGVKSGQLGDETNNPTSAKYVWTGYKNGTGLFKDRTQDQPIFFASEIYFLLAEAALKGYVLDGDAKNNFEQGILASFQYLEEDVSGNIDGDVEDDFDIYLGDNTTSYLVNYDLASTDAERLEAIITQKYIAFNYLYGHESWNEFRRTTYPKITGTKAKTTFVSIKTQSTRTDKLPVRLIYPQSEYNLNKNVPTLSNAFSNPIFWDKD